MSNLQISPPETAPPERGTYAQRTETLCHLLQWVIVFGVLTIVGAIIGAVALGLYTEHADRLFGDDTHPFLGQAFALGWAGLVVGFLIAAAGYFGMWVVHGRQEQR